MNISKFLEDFNKLNSPVEIIGEITNWNEKVECKCKICGEYFSSTPSALKRGSIHRKCSYILRGQKRKSSHDDFVEKIKKIHKDITVIEKYETAQKKIKVKCNNCGNEWYARPCNLLAGHGCRTCYENSKLTDKNNLLADCNYNKSEFFKQNIMQKFNDVIITSNINDVNSKVSLKCKTCGFEWITPYRNIMRLKRTFCCPKCQKLKEKQEMDNITDNELEIFNDLIEKNNFSIKQIPQKKSSEFQLKCNNCGHEWISTYNKFEKCQKCPHCSNYNYKSHEDFETQLQTINDKIILKSKYKTLKEKVSCLCSICGFEWQASPRILLIGGKCPQCTSKKMRQLFAKTKDEFENEIKNRYGSEYDVIGEYVNCKTNVILKHNKCNKTFLYNPELLYGKRIHICPHCYGTKTSEGEYLIRDFLIENNIVFIEQKKFDNLRGVNNGKLSYDFYLPKHNTLIEFNGIQHYKPLGVFGGQPQFDIQKEHDKRKRNYARNNNINLIEIKYDEIDNIDEILLSIINKYAS